MVGLRMMAAMQAVRPSQVPPDNLTILGLANGDLRYITTSEEYWAQLYEGGANLYGPESARLLTSHLRELTESIGSASGTGGPIVEVEAISVKPGKEYSFWPKRGERPQSFRLEAAACRGDTVVARWYDAPPGSMVPRDGLLIEFARMDGGAAAVDDDTDVEVRAIGDEGPGHLWEARWTPPNGVRRGDRFELDFKRWQGSQGSHVEVGC